MDTHLVHRVPPLQKASVDFLLSDMDFERRKEQTNVSQFETRKHPLHSEAAVSSLEGGRNDGLIEGRRKKEEGVLVWSKPVKFNCQINHDHNHDHDRNHNHYHNHYRNHYRNHDRSHNHNH